MTFIYLTVAKTRYPKSNIRSENYTGSPNLKDAFANLFYGTKFFFIAATTFFLAISPSKI